MAHIRAAPGGTLGVECRGAGSVPRGRARDTEVLALYPGPLGYL